jgi:hypothetical protein
MTMAEEVLHEPFVRHPRRFRLRWVALTVVAIPLVAFGLSLVLTPSLEPPRPAESRPLASADAAEVEAAEAKVESLVWPEGRLEGADAKTLLLDVLEAARERLLAVPGYTATFRRRERIDGKIGPPQTIELKVRHRPFGVYMKFLEPEAGKEVVYAEGRYGDDVMAHPGGMARALLPRLKVPPDSKLALAGNRHPITEAGLLNLTEKLIAYRELDLTDPEAITVLDRWTDPEGRAWLRSIHDHPHHKAERPFKYIVVLYDPGTKLPVKITSYDWPKDGQAGDLKLAEEYFYDELKLDAPLTDLDFDPANPAYDFKRF